MAILKIKDKNGNFIGVPTITGMPKGIYIGTEEPVDLDTILWIDTSITFVFSVTREKVSPNDLTYTAEEGMTWGQWVNSTYNVDGWEVDSYNEIVLNYSDGKTTTLREDNSTGYKVLSTDVISVNKVYYGQTQK